MRTITILIIALCLAGTASLQAQTEKGHWLIGASSRTQGIFNVLGSEPSIMNLGFTTWKDKDDSGEEDYQEKHISINMSPRLGYFVVKNLAVGLEMNLAVWKNSWGDEYETSNKISFFTAGPFVRYYIPAGKIYFFLEAGAAFGNQKQIFQTEESDDISTASAKCFGGGGGIALPLGKKVTFDTMLTYNSLNIKEKEDNPDNRHSIIGTFGIKFGFHIFLGK